MNATIKNFAQALFSVRTLTQRVLPTMLLYIFVFCANALFAQVTSPDATESTTKDDAQDRLFTFTKTSSENTMTIDRAIRARVLLVAGGGGGATPGNMSSSVGGPGGGGGGGVLDKETILLPGEYKISVGLGGARHSSSSTASTGNSGNPSEFKYNGTLLYKAIGGGGGGFKGAGLAGGSGGGGSKGVGGAPTEGQGYAGGKGSHNQTGAGGGGAGGVGGDTSSTTASGIGIGGLGIEKDISGEIVVYAAGGNGGVRGGSTTGVAGKNGTGNGGSGGSRNNYGGAGGSGIVVIRFFEEMPLFPATSTEFTYDSTEHIAFEATSQYTIKNSQGEDVDKASATTVGTHRFTVSIVSGLCWADGSTEPIECIIEIKKPTLQIDSFTLTGWQVGEAPSSPVIVSTPKLLPEDYSLIFRRDGSSIDETSYPTVAGRYQAYLVVPESPNFIPPATMPSTSFEIWAAETLANDIKPLGYHIGMTIKDVSAIGANSAMLVKLSENNPQGFSYRYARKNGSDIRFMDSEGNILKHRIDNWNPSGNSFITVEVPSYESGISTTMFWGECLVRNDDDELVSGELPPVEQATKQKPQDSFAEHISFGYVIIRPNTTFVNRWLTDPSIAYTSWVEGKTPAVCSAGESAYGIANYVFENVSGLPITNSIPTAAADYVYASFVVEGKESTGTRSWTSIRDDIANVSITRESPYSDLSGGIEGVTASGRILLFNDYKTTKENIQDQSYLNTNALTTSKTGVYWKHWEASKITGTPSVPYMEVETFHDLLSDNPIPSLCGATNIWHLENVYIGNIYTGTNAVLAASRAYFPMSSYAQVPSSSALKIDASHLYFVNALDSKVYSPCYSNGIGVVYFDVLNVSISNPGDIYALGLEIATNAVQNGISVLPTDSNVDEIDFTTIGEGDDATVVVTTNYYGAAEWKEVDMIPLVRNENATKFEALGKTSELRLQITKGGSTNNFYRVCVPLNIYGPVRFRICRKRIKSGSARKTVDAFIALDNLIVSEPSMRVDFEPYGKFDPNRGGKEALGQENAWLQPYPSVKDDIIVRGKPIYSITPGHEGEVDTSKMVLASKLFYRWRYLDQIIESQWKSVGLNVSKNFEAIAPLDIPKDTQGDVEFFYETKLDAPYYEYVDYSGLGAGLDGLFTEHLLSVTNRINSASLFESRGTNWFVRLRDGSSDYQGFNLIIRDDVITEDEVVGDVTNKVSRDVVRVFPMELVDNHIWRGYLPTPVKLPRDTVEYRIEAVNKQTPGTIEYSYNTNSWHNGTSLNMLPVSSIMAVGSSTDWTPIKLDSTTGYFMFQVDDTLRSLTILHADYQNFNAWADAKKDVFVGTSTLDERKAGTSPKKQSWLNDFSKYLAMPETDADWQVPSVSWTDITYMGGREAYKSFTVDNSDAWQVGLGMWISRWFKAKDRNSGVALQLEGQGRGSVQLTEKDFLPRGLKSVAFNARLGQFINFTDFSYYDGENPLGLTNYTFHSRVAFDLKSNTAFRGNASLSLVARYRAGRGCYELRLEQEEAKVNNNKFSRKEDGLRMTLYRWKYDSNGKMVATQLGSYSSKDLGNYKMQNATGTTGSFTPLYISVTNTTQGAVICCGIGSQGMNDEVTLQQKQGEIRYTGFAFFDKQEDALMNGTYGVLSANCEGVFCSPVIIKKPGFPTGWQLPTSGAKTYKDLLLAYNTSDSNFNSTKLDLLNDLWVISPGRMEVEVDNQKKFFAIRSSSNLEQTLKLYTAPAGKSTWQLYKEFTVDGFGCSTNETADVEEFFYSPESFSIRLEAGGTSDDIRRDVVVESLELKQWAGTNWDDTNGARPYVQPHWEESTSSFGLTNFIFSSAWLDGTGVVLSAKRTLSGKPCSLRSPLMDGYEFRDGISRGTGLGMATFAYKNAHPATKLLLQIATNDVSQATIRSLDIVDDTIWTTVTNFDFTAMSTEERLGGTLSAYIGVHGVSGVMRLIVDPELVENAKLPANKNDANYGSVIITRAFCRDEPALDDLSWWGWNLRTIGADALGKDNEGKMYLPDLTRILEDKVGLSLALNNSVSVDDGDILPDDEVSYKEHMPFVQSPTFGTNIVGTVSFKARNYYGDATTAYVAIYGCESGLEEDDTKWTFLTNIVVSTPTYKAYTYTTDPGRSFGAFRFAVTGVDGISRAISGDLPEGVTKASRVMIDEITVCEAIRARMSFRNVGAFHSDMSGDKEVPNVPSKLEQPLCNEGWGVQCEIFASQLEEEINHDRDPVVTLHWFEGDWPWGYENWNNQATAKSAELYRVPGSNLVYRSTYLKAPDAVIPMATTPGTLVQYMLEVRYWMKGSSVAATNYLTLADWERPSWYAPLDYNADYNSFSAYSILDTVSPGWAWLNEINVMGICDENTWENSERDSQFIEIAVPETADITGWSVRMLHASPSSDTVTTNVLGVFGTDQLSGTKDITRYAASNMVFRVLASPDSHEMRGGKLRVSEGEVDGIWSFDPMTYSTLFEADDEIGWSEPFAFQLVRASGVIEHEVVGIGTNFFGTMPGLEKFYDPMRSVEFLNEKLREARFIYVGEDCSGYLNGAAHQDASISVLTEHGETPENWNNAVVRTPGRINAGQVITGEPPTPNGETIIIFARVDQDVGNIVQTVGDAVKTNGTQTIFIKRGSTVGTNIVYETSRWYVLDQVTTNGVALAQSQLPLTGQRTYTVNVGAGVSNNLNVVARARLSDKLADYGITEDNRYRPAIIDWLQKGTSLYGPFANPDDETIHLAEHISAHTGNFLREMTLTEMYWFDVDPTCGNLALASGVTAPMPVVVDIPAYDGGTETITNRELSAIFFFTNRTTNAAWVPTHLRGLAPGETSYEYTGKHSSWTSVTFKVSGLLAANGISIGTSEDRNWVPLRWFVFRKDSFNPIDHPTAPAKSIIDIADPYSTFSPGYNAGWYDWIKDHPNDPLPNIFNRWEINDKLGPYFVEPLAPTNYLYRNSDE